MDVKQPAIAHQVSVGIPLPRISGWDVVPFPPLRQSLQAMYNHCHKLGIEVKEIPLDTGRGLAVHQNHTALANEMWGDWLLIVGSDHSFPPDSLEKLLAAATTEEGDVIRPIISGVAVYKTPPHRIVGYRRDPSGKNYMSLRPYIDVTEADVLSGGIIDIEDGACGSGFCLYHRKVFDEVMYPWFDPGVRADDLVSYGPDLRLCADAHKVGINCAVHLGVEVMHWDFRPTEPGRCLEHLNEDQSIWLAEMFHMTNEGINEEAVQNVMKMWEDYYRENIDAEAESGGK